MDLSHLLTNCKVYTAVQSSIELIPDKQAAVYAFYDLLNFDTPPLIDNVDTFLTKHGRNMKLNASNWPFTLELSFRGNAERFKGEGRELCLHLEEEKRPRVQEMLLFLSLLSEPLYIGKTDNLRTRFRQHHDGGFLFKMKDKFQRSPEEFLLFAFCCEPEFVRLVESVLIQVLKPPFNDQTS